MGRVKDAFLGPDKSGQVPAYRPLAKTAPLEGGKVLASVKGRFALAALALGPGCALCSEGYDAVSKVETVSMNPHDQIDITTSGCGPHVLARYLPFRRLRASYQPALPLKRAGKLLY